MVLFRSFVLFVTLLFLGCTSREVSQESVRQKHGQLAIMQGWTTQGSTELVLSQRKNQKLKIVLVDPKTEKHIMPNFRQLNTFADHSMALLNLTFTDLPHTGPYELIVRNEKKEILDQRELRLLSRPAGAKLKWAIVSCMRDDMKDLDSIWGHLKEQKPHVVMMIGDNTYVDMGVSSLQGGATPATLWQRHMQTRQRLPLFRDFSLTPVFSTWDDHDYGKNDGGASYRFKEQSQKIFRQFFPMGPMDFERRGVAQSTTLAGQHFVFLDNRSFRSEKGNVGEGEHFGVEQRGWAFSKIADAQGLTWLISGDQFFGRHHPYESFEGRHPRKFKSFLAHLKKLKKSVVFVSGDRHLSEVSKIPKSFLGFETYEFTSSPIHSTVYPGALEKFPNPRQIVAVDGIWNYMFMESQSTSSKTLAVKVRTYSKNGQQLFSQDLTIKH